MAETDRTTDPAVFRWSFLGPRYWGTWLLLGAFRILGRLPRRWVMWLGAQVGDLYRLGNRKRRRIAEVNLALCFPERSAAERRQLLEEHFRAHGRGILDMGVTLWCNRRRLLELVDLEGFEEQRDRVASGRVLTVTWHLTTLEVTGLLMTLAGPSVSMMKPLDNALLTWAVARARCRLSDLDLAMRDDGLRPLLKGLRSGRQCILVPDEDFGGGGADIVYVPFFGVPRAMVTTPGRIARASGAAVTVCAARLDPGTGRYLCTFSPPLEGVRGDDPQADAAAICAAMEGLIRRAPEQYLWTFRWFRSRPDGGDSPYDPAPGWD